MTRHLLLALGAALLAGCTPPETHSPAHRTPAMDTPPPRIEVLFQQTKPVCFGHFIIDVPATAKVVWGPTHVGWEIVSYPYQGINIPAQIQDKTNEFKAIKHLEVPSALIGVFDGPNQESKIVVGYPSRHDAYETRLYSYIELAPHAFMQTASALMAENALAQPPNPDGYRKTLSQLEDIARRLRVRDESEIPTEPGVCIQAGFVSGEDKYEMTSIGFRFPEYPDVSFSMLLIKSDRVNADDSLEVAVKEGQKNAEEAGEGRWYRTIKRLRHGVRRMGDWDGSEWLIRRPPPPTEKGHPWTHEFFYKSIGVANDSLRPYVNMEMSTGVDANEKGAVEPSLKDDEAVALWDKLTTTIRVRPTGGARPGSASDPAQPLTPPPVHSKVPLGTTLSSGTRCPQSGTWVCDRATALGGARRFYSEGQTLSEVIVPVPRSLIQKLLRKPKNYLFSTVWTLAELPPGTLA